jgi:hypothetical protein
VKKEVLINSIFCHFSYDLAHLLEIILPFEFLRGFRFVGINLAADRAAGMLLGAQALRRKM